MPFGPQEPQRVRALEEAHLAVVQVVLCSIIFQPPSKELARLILVPIFNKPGCLGDICFAQNKRAAVQRESLRRTIDHLQGQAFPKVVKKLARLEAQLSHRLDLGSLTAAGGFTTFHLDPVSLALHDLVNLSPCGALRCAHQYLSVGVNLN